MSNRKSSLQALLEEVKQEKPDFSFLTPRKVVARSSRVRVRTRPHLNSRDAFRGTVIQKDFTETWGQKTNLQHVMWEILDEIEESELKRTFKIASQQGWLRLNLTHCTHTAHKCEFKHACVCACVSAWVLACVCECVCECTNLVATASSGKWRLLNTRAKAPSWEEKDLEETQTLPSSDKSPAPELTAEGDYQARKQKPA